MMKIKAEIFQIIKWEERNSYFYHINWKDDGEYDCLHIRLPNPKARWYHNLFGLITNFFYNARVYEMDEFPFNTGIAFWVKRPHNFKLNDEVEIDINISKKGV